MLRILNRRDIRTTMSALFALALFCHAPAYGERPGDMEDINKFLENAARLGREIKIQDNPNKSKGQEEARKLMEYYQSDAFRRRYESEVERLKGTVFKNTLDSYYGELKGAIKGSARKGILPQNERIYLFVSSSIPVNTLRNYARDLDRLGDPNVFMVMRGFVDEMKRVKPTLDFVKRVIAEDANCDVTARGCKAYRVNIKIDPLLFRKYGITRVPAAVYVADLKMTDQSLSEGMEKNVTTGTHFALYGDASIAHILETFRRESGSQSIEPLLEALKGGIYHQEVKR